MQSITLQWFTVISREFRSTNILKCDVYWSVNKNITPYIWGQFVKIQLAGNRV